MTLTAWRFGSAVALAVVLKLLSAMSGSEPVAQAQPDCTVTVQPGQSIQRAIDEAKEGAVICLAAGTYEENIEIKKSLTMRGTSQEQTKIKGIEESKSIIEITNDAVIEVKLESFTIAENKSSGIDLGGSARATISHMTITGNWQGIGLRDSAQATISNSTISENMLSGVALIGSAQATINYSIISKNELYGIALMDSAQANITHSTISESEYGVWLASLAQDTIATSTISRNRHLGIWLWRSTQATITDSTISRNAWSGIVLLDSAQAEIKGSVIESNGAGENCKEKESINCDGIGLYDQSRVKIVDSKIITNANWGVWAFLKQCGKRDNFTGQATFENMKLEDISRNNTTGNQNGMGNPGNHPWNRPEVPDGQVCLP